MRRTHRASECEGTVKKCTNCTYSNSRYNTRYEDNHEATDYNRCKVYKKMVNKYIDTTDYSVEPIVQIQIAKADKVGNTFDKAWLGKRTLQKRIEIQTQASEL